MDPARQRRLRRHIATLKHAAADTPEGRVAAALAAAQRRRDGFTDAEVADAIAEVDGNASRKAELLGWTDPWLLDLLGLCADLTRCDLVVQPRGQLLVPTLVGPRAGDGQRLANRTRAQVARVVGKLGGEDALRNLEAGRRMEYRYPATSTAGWSIPQAVSVPVTLGELAGNNAGQVFRMVLIRGLLRPAMEEHARSAPEPVDAPDGVVDPTTAPPVTTREEDARTQDLAARTMSLLQLAARIANGHPSWANPPKDVPELSARLALAAPYPP